MISRKGLISLVIALLSISVVYAANENVEFVSAVGGPTNAVAVSADGGTGYIGEGANGNLYAQMPGGFPKGREFAPRHLPQREEVGILPSAISENVEFVGTTGGSVQDVFVQDNYAYVCAGGTLTILDVSAPSNPIKVGYVALPDFAYSVYVQDSLAYVADVSSGLRIIDVSVPSSPVEVGFYDTPDQAYGVYVQDSLAYVADGVHY